MACVLIRASGLKYTLKFKIVAKNASDFAARAACEARQDRRRTALA